VASGSESPHDLAQTLYRLTGPVARIFDLRTVIEHRQHTAQCRRAHGGDLIANPVGMSATFGSFLVADPAGVGSFIPPLIFGDQRQQLAIALARDALDQPESLPQ